MCLIYCNLSFACGCVFFVGVTCFCVCISVCFICVLFIDSCMTFLYIYQYIVSIFIVNKRKYIKHFICLIIFCFINLIHATLLRLYCLYIYINFTPQTKHVSVPKCEGPPDLPASEKTAGQGSSSWQSSELLLR